MREDNKSELGPSGEDSDATEISISARSSEELLITPSTAEGTSGNSTAYEVSACRKILKQFISRDLEEMIEYENSEEMMSLLHSKSMGCMGTSLCLTSD